MPHTPQRLAAEPGKQTAPAWLLAALGLCGLFLLLFLFCRSAQGSSPASESSPPAYTTLPAPTEEAQPVAETPAPEPEKTPRADYDYTQPVPATDGVDEASWFADAVFIGDSRTDGFHLYSGITTGDFLDYNGITVFDVMEEKPVIRQGAEKVSILTALGQKQYGKVYLSLGVNELGYFDAQRFADTYGQLIAAIRQSQPQAQIYLQALIPVNTEKCLANDQPYYVTNQGISDYNAALSALAAREEVYFLRVDEALVDETGEVPRELTGDGVHFKKEGYAKWLDYLLTHTVAPQVP